MPTMEPVIGEVWEYNHADRDTATSAVVAGILEGSYLMLASNGRRVVVPRRSLELVWRLKENAPDRTCKVCSQQGCAQDITCTWYCEPHLPRNTPVFLPGESVSTDFPTLHKVCPFCEKTSGKYSWEFIEGFMLFRCTCKGRWVMLALANKADDGLALFEDLHKAYALLESKELCPNIRVHVGTLAYKQLSQTVGRLINNTDPMAGIRINLSDTYGRPNVVLCGISTASSDENPAPSKLDVELDSWWVKKGTTQSLRVSAILDDKRLLRVVVFDESTKSGVTLPIDMFLNSHSFVSYSKEDDNEVFLERPALFSIWRARRDNLAIQVLSMDNAEHRVCVKFSTYELSYTSRTTLKDFLREHYTNEDCAVHVGNEYYPNDDPNDDFATVVKVDQETVTFQHNEVKTIWTEPLLLTVSERTKLVRKGSLDRLISEEIFSD